MNLVFQHGDLVYSFADEKFYLILEVIGSMLFKVYTMAGETKEIIDITLTHIDSLQLKQCENGKFFYYNKL